MRRGVSVGGRLKAAKRRAGGGLCRRQNCRKWSTDSMIWSCSAASACIIRKPVVSSVQYLFNDSSNGNERHIRYCHILPEDS